MDLEQSGTTTENGAEMEKEQATPEVKKEAMPDNTQGDGVKSVPFARFQQTNERRKAAETALETACEMLAQQIPQNFQALIPKTLPIGERLAWINDAVRSGIFTQQVTSNSPDPSRPQPKPEINLDNATPHSLMSAGYK